MSTVTKAISSVEFHVNARQANAALQSIQEEAKRCREQVEELQEQAAKGVTTVKVDGMDVDIQKRIREVKALQKTWESAAQSQIKGAKAFDELWKNARMGTIESMTGAQIKAGVNASKPIYDRLRLGDAEDRMKAQAIKDMQDQGQKVLNQLKTTTDQIIKQIADGETIAADVLEREARNLKSIMDLLPPLSQEWKDYNLQYQAINQQIERQTVLERQLRGEIVTREDAIRVINAANREATQQEIAQEEQRAKAAREAAEAKASEADQYRTTVEQKQSEIFATNDLIAAKRREIDAHHESAAAAKDAADKARDAAYKDRKQAEQEARDQQDAYNKQKKIRDDAAKDVEKFRKELEKLGEVKAEPKIDTGQIKKLEQELESLKKDLTDATTDLNRSQGNLAESLKPLEELGLKEADLEDKAKLRAAAEKKVLEIMEAQANVEKEVAEQSRKIISGLKPNALGGTKADQDFYAKNKNAYAIDDNIDDVMERIAHLETVSKLKNGRKFSDDTYWDPDDELDESEAIVMTDKEKQNALDELRVLKQHVREVILKAIREVGDVDKAVLEVTGGDGVAEDTKFGEQINDKISDLKDKIQEQITTTLESYEEILDEVDRDEKLSKQEVEHRVNSHIEYLKDNVARDRDDVNYFQGKVNDANTAIAAKEKEIELTKQQTTATAAQTEATEKLAQLQEEYNQKVERRKQLEQELEAVKNRSWTDDPEKKRLVEEIAKLNELIAVADKYKKQFTKMTDEKFEEGFLGKVSEKDSVYGAADYLKRAYEDRRKSRHASNNPDNAEYQEAAKRAAAGIVDNAQENLRRAIFSEIQNGRLSSAEMERTIQSFRNQLGNVISQDYNTNRNLKENSEYAAYKYIIAQMEKYLEVAKQVEAEQKQIAGGEPFLKATQDNYEENIYGISLKDQIKRKRIEESDLPDARASYNEKVATLGSKLTHAKNEEAEAERNLTEAKKQSTTATAAQTDAIKAQEQELEKLNQKIQKLKQDGMYDPAEGSVQDAIAERKRLISDYEKEAEKASRGMDRSKEGSKTYEKHWEEWSDADQWREAYEIQLKALQELEKAEKEKLELEQRIAAAQQQSTTATAASNEQDEKRAGVQQKLADAEARLADENRKLNEQADKTITANQQATQAANEHQQSVKALGDVMEENRKTGQRLGEEIGQLTKQQKQQTEELAEASEKMTDAEKESNRHIKTEQEARLRIQQLNNQSIEQLTASLRVLEEENRRINDPGNQRWQENERYIGQVTLRLEELKKQSAELRREPVLDMMTQRMDQLGTLSRDALAETKKFWETMVAGAENGSGELAEYEQHLKSIALEEQARVREQGREAFAFFQREDYRRTNAADTEEQRKALVAYRDALPADATDHIEAINALLEKHAQFVKEAAGEWMSLEKAMELASKAGTDQFAGSAKDIQLATQSLERQRDTIIATIREKRNLGQATKTEEDQLADLTKKLRSLKFEQDNVNMSQEKMRTLIETPANAVNLDELRAAIKRADGQLRQMEQSLGQNSDEYKRFAEQVRNAKNVMKEMEGQAKASATAWEKAFNRLKTYVVMYMGFNEVWQKVTGTARDLMDLSDRMGEVRKTTGFTADEVGRLSDNLTKLDTRTNLTGLMEFSSLAGSVGLKTQEAVQGFTEAANMLSVSLPELGKEASRTLMKIADATGDLEKNGGNVRETLERVGSTVIALRANSAAAAGPITDFVSRVGAVGAQAGISIDQIAALGATVDALGGRVEMSATALSRMIPAIRNNTFEVAQAIGMTEKQLKQMSGIDQMVAVFKALNNSVKNFDMTTEEGMNAAADAVEGMLGRSVSMQDVMKQLNQQGARAGIVFGLLSQNVDTLEKQLKIATDAYRDNTALMAEYNKMNDTTAAKWERLKNAFEEMWVSDSAQRGLGVLIDMLRKLVDWIAEDGPIIKGLKVMLAYWASMKMNIGATIASMGAGFKAMGTAIGAGTNVLATAAGAAINSMTGMTNSMRGLRAATVNARREWIKMDAAMRANIIGALVTALGFLIYKIWDMHHAAKEAAAEVGRFNQQLSNERKALNDMFEPLNKSNMAQEERSKLIKEINSQYGRYLGYMLSEYSSAIQLADAHALIAKRIKEEAYERRLAEQEKKIYEKHDEDVNAAYGGIESAVRGGAKNGADVQAIADMMKSFVDKNMDAIVESGKTLPKGFVEKIDGMTERLVQDGKLTREGASEARTAMFKYLDEAKEQAVELKNATAGIRSDLRDIQGAIKVDLANNLNTLISNVANSVSNAVRQVQNKQQPQQSPYLQRPGSGMPSLFGGGQQGGTSWQAPWQQGSRETTPDQQMAPAGWKPNINKKDVNAVRQFVQDQEALRGALKAGGRQIDEAQRRVAESWLLTDEQLKEYRTIISKAERRGGGGGTNLYGQYNKVTSPYKDWNGNDLVARRKEMLERVKALANGADVQAVLSEDAKFISEAVRKNIKTTEQAIEWYNTERLKIQEALHGKHLTNTGDWQDPEKVRKRAGRVVQDEMKYYLDELDAYYTERKTRIEQARNDEEITEGEAWRRTIQNDNEWQTRRAELQLLYSRRAAKVTEEEMQAIFGIISERTGETVNYIKADIAQTNKFIVDVGKKSKAAMDRIYGDIELGAEKSYLKAAQAIGKQMKFIEDTLAKERPYDGITKNLQDNLDKMGVLAAKYRRENEELARQGKEPKYSNEQITAQSYDEMAFYLRQAADAYSIDIDELLRRMVNEGMTATAEEISKSDMLKQAVMGQLRKTYQEVQDAVKKEASQIKKDVEIIWNDDARGIGGMSMKATFDKALAQLGMQQDSVSRANSLIGAGAASDNVASRLAMKQIEVQMRMQKAQYDMYRVQANQRMAALKAEAEEHRRLAKQMEKENHLAESKRELLMATNAERDAENVRLSLGLTLAEETKKEEEQKAELLKIQEESQNRLYTSLREWADLLTSSLQGVFEASHAGDAEYYNERAKLNLTGKGGPGAGTYTVIDDAGTSDATAHYEYLDERQALERQHEIEVQNAQAEAWRKLMDDINMKMSETITDQLNAMLQNSVIDANTQAVIKNTEALYASMGAAGEGGSGDGYKRNAEGFAVDEQGQIIAPVQPTGETPSGEGMPKAPWQMTDEEVAKNQENMGLLWQTYKEQAIAAETEKAEMLTELPGYVPSPLSITDEQIEATGEKLDALKQKEIAASTETAQAKMQAQEMVKKSEQQNDQQMVKTNKSSFAAMTAAANMYGIAYQTMSNDNLDTSQKVQMMIVQAAGQAAISMLTASMAASTGETAANAPSWISKTLKELGPIGGPVAVGVFTALIGGLMGLATSKIAKSKSEIAQATGASVGAGRLATGMLTYAEGNVNELTDPASLTPGRQYNVDGADGKTYRAKYMGKGAKTHITNGPEFHLVGEAGREAIIDAKTTRLLQMNETGIWRDIQTLYNGGSISGLSTRRRRGTGMRAFADGNIGEFEDMADGGGLTAEETGGMNADMMASMLETNSRLADLLEDALTNGIKAVNKWTGSDGIPAMYNKMQKEAQRHGEKYL